MATDFGLFEPCFYHRVCGGVVVGDDTVCDTCRTAWGPLLRLRPAMALESEADAAADEVSSHDGTNAAAVQAIKLGQLCWLCEQRRRCCLIAGRWECTSCR